MNQKKFLDYVCVLQVILIYMGIGFLILWPPFTVFYGELINREITQYFYFLSVATVTIVMILRPLANIFPQFKWLCCLVTLRKGFGILSASLIVGMILADIVEVGTGYFSYMLSPAYWSWETKRLLAHIGDLSAVILLVTSNNYSKRLLGGKNWKRVQKLAYVYFYCGATYEYFSFGSTFAVLAIITVTFLTLWAYVINWQKKHPPQPCLCGN